MRRDLDLTKATACDRISLHYLIILLPIMNDIYSLTKVPSAPRKKKVEKKFKVERIRPLLLPKSPVSIDNPPNAPRKQHQRQRPTLYPILLPPLENEEWEVTSEDLFHDVGSKFLRYDADSVQRISDIDLLKDIYRWYNPPTCPRTIAESIYVKLVSDAAEARLKALGSDVY